MTNHSSLIYVWRNRQRTSLKGSQYVSPLLQWMLGCFLRTHFYGIFKNHLLLGVLLGEMNTMAILYSQYLLLWHGNIKLKSSYLGMGWFWGSSLNSSLCYKSALLSTYFVCMSDINTNSNRNLQISTILHIFVYALSVCVLLCCNLCFTKK